MWSWPPMWSSWPPPPPAGVVVGWSCWSRARPGVVAFFFCLACTGVGAWGGARSSAAAATRPGTRCRAGATPWPPGRATRYAPATLPLPTPAAVSASSAMSMSMCGCGGVAVVLGPGMGMGSHPSGTGWSTPRWAAHFGSTTGAFPNLSASFGGKGM
jgi:hypothetical protein